jgi:hypothetical protein
MLRRPKRCIALYFQVRDSARSATTRAFCIFEHLNGNDQPRLIALEFISP